MAAMVVAEQGSAAMACISRHNLRFAFSPIATMLDILLLRKDLDSAIARLTTRKNPQPFLNVEAFRTLEAERKTLQTRTEELQAQRNQLSKQIGMLMGKGEKDAAEAAKAQVAAFKDELDASAQRLESIQAELATLLLAVPNLPHESVHADFADSIWLLFSRKKVGHGEAGVFDWQVGL